MSGFGEDAVFYSNERWMHDEVEREMAGEWVRKMQQELAERDNVTVDCAEKVGVGTGEQERRSDGRLQEINTLWGTRRVSKKGEEDETKAINKKYLKKHRDFLI